MRYLLIQNATTQENLIKNVAEYMVFSFDCGVPEVHETGTLVLEACKDHEFIEYFKVKHNCNTAVVNLIQSGNNV